MGILSEVGSVISQFRLWMLMGNQDIRLRYKRSFIGPFWLSITMGTFVVGIGLLYSQILKQPFEEYLLYFGCGMLAWTLISGLVLEGAMAVLENEGNLRSVRMPIPVMVARVVYRNLLIFLHNAVVIVALFVYFGRSLELSAFMAVGGVATILVCGFLLGIVLAPLCARFRDVQQVLSNLMQLLFFLTPIFWTASAAGGRPLIVEGNPFYHLIELVRAPLLGNEISQATLVMTVGIFATLLVLALGSLAVSRNKVYVWV